MSAGSWKQNRRLIRIATLLLVPVAATQLWSQTDGVQSPTPAAALETANEAPSIPVFAVISIKQNNSGRGWRDGSTPDGYSATNVTLNWILPEAYGIRQRYRIFGTPGWADTNRYDIEARVDDSDIPTLQKLDWKLRYSMIQQILTDRFKIKVHRENRTQPIYSLIVVSKDRLPPQSDPNSTRPNNLVARSRGGQLTLINSTMTGFADFMSGSLGRQVVDNTGLTARYDLKLDWNPNEGDVSNSDSSAPSVFTAVQEQLGLKLVPATGPVECLVVDHVEPPTEN